MQLELQGRDRRRDRAAPVILHEGRGYLHEHVPPRGGCLGRRKALFNLRS
eukprot:COSAG01_NODE_17712_length_1129_cov_1369.589320_2_plen_49_part_01